MKKLEDVGVLVVCILMLILFIIVGWGKIIGYVGIQQYMEVMGVLGVLLLLIIFFEFGGGLVILFGFLIWIIVLFIVGFMLLIVFLFYSNFVEGVNFLMFMKNLIIVGGYLLLVIIGLGVFSIDCVLNKKW